MYEMARQLGVDLSKLPGEEGYIRSPEPMEPETPEPTDPSSPVVLDTRNIVVSQSGTPKVMTVRHWSDGDISIHVLEGHAWFGFTLGRGPEQQAFLTAISPPDHPTERGIGVEGTPETQGMDVEAWLDREGMLPRPRIVDPGG